MICSPSPAASALLDLLDQCPRLQDEATAAWHAAEPEDRHAHPEAFAHVAPDPAADALAGPVTLYALTLAQHLRNFRLWHVEDVARRRDVGPEIIADCKRRIDRLNQERNDRMERVDACLIALLEPLLPPAREEERPRQNTESLGMAVDRLSILSLKIWHMAEQTRRTDVDAAHRTACEAKLAVLRTQRSDLALALRDLAEEFLAGSKRPKLYLQFKMYNDPALNPELYGKNAHGL